MTLSTQASRSYRPRSDATTFIRAAPSNDRLNTRVLETLVRKSRMTSPRATRMSHRGSPLTSSALPKRPISACVGDRGRSRPGRCRRRAGRRASAPPRDSRARNTRGRATHEQVAVQAEVLQHVFAMVRVIPVDAGVAKEDAVSNEPPGGTGSCVTCGTPSKRLSSRSPCQCIAVGKSVRFTKRTTIVAASCTWMSGPGYWPLKPSIVTVRPKSTRRTGAASSVSDADRRAATSSRGRASGIAGSRGRQVR